MKRIAPTHIFPPGTPVRAYPRSAWPSVPAYVEGAPEGEPVYESEIEPDGTVQVDCGSGQHVLVGDVEGAQRHVLFFG